MRRVVGLIFVLWAYSLEAKTCENELRTLARSGDLVFSALSRHPWHDAIYQSALETHGEQALKINHVGIILQTPHDTYVIEAAPDRGVALNSLSDFVTRSSQKLYFRPLPVQWDDRRSWIVRHALSAAGSRYNHSFRYCKNEFYCSSFVFHVFEKSLAEQNPLQLHPMSFGQPETRARHLWEHYFEQIGQEMPLGQLGISPHSVWHQLDAFETNF